MLYAVTVTFAGEDVKPKTKTFKVNARGEGEAMTKVQKQTNSYDTEIEKFSKPKPVKEDVSSSHLKYQDLEKIIEDIVNQVV